MVAKVAELGTNVPFTKVVDIIEEIVGLSKGGEIIRDHQRQNLFFFQSKTLLMIKMMYNFNEEILTPPQQSDLGGRTNRPSYYVICL